MNRLLVGPMTVVELPAAAGLIVERELTAWIVADVAGRPGGVEFKPWFAAPRSGQPQ